MFMWEDKEKKKESPPLRPYFYVLKLHFALMGQCVIDVILLPTEMHIQIFIIINNSIY